MPEPTAWRPLTRDETDRGGGLHVLGPRTDSLVVLCLDATHDCTVPLLPPTDGPPQTWTGVCGACRRWYRLRLEVGCEATQGATDWRGE